MSLLYVYYRITYTYTTTRELNRTFKGRLELARGMDWGLVSAILSLICIISVFYGVRLVGVAINEAMSNLDGQLAAAISSLMSSGLEALEPPNPIQGAIANFITQRLADGPIDLPRNPDGKFS